MPANTVKIIVIVAALLAVLAFWLLTIEVRRRTLKKLTDGKLLVHMSFESGDVRHAFCPIKDGTVDCSIFFRSAGTPDNARRAKTSVHRPDVIWRGKHPWGNDPAQVSVGEVNYHENEANPIMRRVEAPVMDPDIATLKMEQNFASQIVAAQLKIYEALQNMKTGTIVVLVIICLVVAAAGTVMSYQTMKANDQQSAALLRIQAALGALPPSPVAPPAKVK